MARILIKNGRVWDGDQFLAADVLCVGEVVSRIEPKITEQADFVYDAQGRIVSAGLVDIHTHMRHVSCDDYGIPIDAVCLPFGVTAAVDASTEKGSKALLDGWVVKGAVFAACQINGALDKADFTITRHIMELYGDACIGIKVFFDRTGGVRSIRPLREICEFARENGKRVMVHSNHSPAPMEEIADVLQKGDIITHVYHGGDHTVESNDYAPYRIAKQKGITLDVGMAGHVHTDFGVLARAIKAGILPDTISTDITNRSAYQRGGRYGLTTCMSILHALGMSDEDVLRAVTSSAAKAVGKEELWGRLAVGRRADIIVLDHKGDGFSLSDAAGNHAEGEGAYRCLLTVADGLVVYKDQ